MPLCNHLPLPLPQATNDLFLSIELTYTCSRISSKWNIQDRLLYLASLAQLKFLRFIHVFVCISTCSFLLLKGILSYEYIIICLSIHLLINIWIISSFGPFWIKLLKQMYRSLGEHMLSVILSKYLGEKLLVSVWITWQKTANVFPKKLHYFTLPPVTYEHSSCSTSSSTFALVSLSNYSYSSAFVKGSYYSYKLHFPHDGICSACFHGLIGLFIYLLLWSS